MMIARRGLVLVLLAAFAIAAGAETRPAQTDALVLTTGETKITQIFGITAAWSLDPAIVDAVAQQGSVSLFARGAGRTTVVVVGVTGEHRFDVVVNGRGTTSRATTARADQAMAEARYSSGARELQNSVAITRVDPKKRVEAAVRTIHRSGDAPGDRPQTSVATATYRIFTPGRELTFLDRDVDHSPLTLEATPLRGIHYLDEHWRLHAGYTAHATYRSFLVPVERELVAGGGYAFRTGRYSTLTPNVFAIRGEGTIASLLYDYHEPGRLFVRGEVGYSHGIGGAAELAWDDDDDRVRAAVRYRPDGFAVAGTTTPHGFFGDGSWTHTYRRDSVLSASWSATDTLGMRVISAGADVDHRLTDVLSLTGGASWASFNGRRTFTVPAGVRADFRHGGVTALYRYTQAFNNEGGHGFRIAGRVNAGHVYASAFADQQRNAPTLEVIFSERPDLALALAELGIVATSPADVARALREEAALRELGFIDGITLDLAPVRTQLGLDVALLGTSRSRQQLRARVLRNVIETVAARTTTLIATFTYSRRLTDATDVFGSWTYWRTDTPATRAHVQPFFEVGVRQRFDSLPAIFGGSGTISGVVFPDDDLDGRADGGGVAAEVELDGTRRQRTDNNGAFAFSGVARGSHKVVARVPERPDAYFTTPSSVEASPGDRVAFGVASTPARLFGRIADDAGDAIGGVRLLLQRGAKQLIATSGTDGRFAFAAAPGEWQLSIVGDSVPPGYSLNEMQTRNVMLDRARPSDAELVVRAHRVIRGQAAPRAEIDLQPLGRRIVADDQGRFTVRSLAPGVVTLTIGGVAHRVDVPREPSTIEVDLGAKAPVTMEARGEREARLGEHVVQIGAFRIHDNAVDAAARARAAGVAVVLSPSGALTLVHTAPVSSRAEAAAIAAQLRRAGIDAVVLTADAKKGVRR